MSGTEILYWKPGLAATQDWRRVSLLFNTLDHTQVHVRIGLWWASQGRVWIDDIALEEVGIINVLRRTGTPVTVENLDGSIAYEEGGDYEYIEDPQVQRRRFSDHAAVPIDIPPGSAINDGQRLRVSYYHAQVLGKSQIPICMSEPGVTDAWRSAATTLAAETGAKRYLLSMDEIRAGASCELCKARGLTPGELLAETISAQMAILRNVSPKAEFFVWSDMLDPNHNGHDGDFFFVEDGFYYSWQNTPSDVVMVPWLNPIRDDSLQFLSQQGFQTLWSADRALGGGDPTSFLVSLDQTPGARGIMYTTWVRDYDLAGDFGDRVLAWPLQDNDSDSDLMGDDWEDALGLDSSDSADAALDQDSDGISNLEEYRAAVDECTLVTDDCQDATCTQTSGGAVCVCDSGFERIAATCSDLDECALGTDDCHPDATCTNAAGSFACSCNAGFVGDGVHCYNAGYPCTIDVDECGDGAFCASVAGAQICVCRDGFEGDGTTCVDRDECANASDDCDDNALCTNTNGSFTCACLEGYVGDGRTCEPDQVVGRGCSCSGSNPGDPFMYWILLLMTRIRRQRTSKGCQPSAI
jgi:hypothetical protein